MAAYLPSTPRFSPAPVGTKAAMRASYSVSSIKTLIVFLTASISIMSPFLTIPIGPPLAASGVMCPTSKPWLPPEKRPSVMSATSLISPRPATALVGESISRIPGPPTGPSLRITTTSPATTSPRRIPMSADSSPS